MVIPKFVILNGGKITTKYVKNLFRDEGKYGDYHTFEMCISLDADMSEQKKEIIYCHELVEAIKDQYLLNEMDHNMIQPLALALFELFKKNQVKFND